MYWMVVAMQYIVKVYLPRRSAVVDDNILVRHEAVGNSAN
jgi:hypothetical protein